MTGSDDQTAKVWDAKTGAEVLTLKGHTGPVTSASFSPDGLADRHREYATGRRRCGTRRVGAEVLTLKGHTSFVNSASFSPDGSRIVTGSHGQIRRRCGTPRPGPRSSHSRGTANRVLVGVVQPGRVADRDREWGQDGEGLGCEDRGRASHLKGHTGFVISASFSPDGSRIVTGSFDETAKVWDATDGAEVLTLKGHTGRRLFGVVQPGRLADRDRELRQDGEGVGRGATVASLHLLKGHTGAVYSASFSPDGSRIVTASGRRTAKVWDASGGRGPHPLRTRRIPSFGVVQPGRLADRHREHGPDGEGLGRQTRPRLLTLKGHTARVLRRVQPGRLADRHRELGQDGEGLGREERRRGPHPQGAHGDVCVGVVQPGRLADRHRQPTTAPPRSGTQLRSTENSRPGRSLRRRGQRGDARRRTVSGSANGDA